MMRKRNICREREEITLIGSFLDFFLVYSKKKLNENLMFFLKEKKLKNRFF